MSNIPSEVNHTTSFSARQPVGALGFTLLCLQAHTHPNMKHTAWKLKGFCTIIVATFADFTLRDHLTITFLEQDHRILSFVLGGKKQDKMDQQAKALYTDADN